MTSTASTAPSTSTSASASTVDPGPLAEVSRMLVDHLTDEVRAFRRLELRLDGGDVSDAELRRVLGEQFASAMQGLALARGFHDSMSRLEQAGPVTAASLLDSGNVDAVLAGWLRDMADAASLVSADLVAVDALSTMVAASDDAQSSSSQAALELIKALTANAITRLDVAHVPDVEASPASSSSS